LCLDTSWTLLVLQFRPRDRCMEFDVLTERLKNLEGVINATASTSGCSFARRLRHDSAMRSISRFAILLC